MNKHIVTGLVIGLLFCAVIVWGAASSAIATGGAVLLAAVLDGLFGGLAIGALIAANFALSAEEESKSEAAHRTDSHIRTAA
jgi:hypothetical protein